MTGSPSSVVSIGFGSWGSTSLVLTLGFGTETVAAQAVTSLLGLTGLDAYFTGYVGLRPYLDGEVGLVNYVDGLGGNRG